MHCYFAVLPTASALECEPGSEVEAVGCLFAGKAASASAGAKSATLPKKLFAVVSRALFSAKHCVWRGVAAALMVVDGEAILRGCQFLAEGILRINCPYILVSKLLARARTGHQAGYSAPPMHPCPVLSLHASVTCQLGHAMTSR